MDRKLTRKVKVGKVFKEKISLLEYCYNKK